MSRKIYLIFICVMSMNWAQSQDLHFSQYYSSPLYLNPAFTGAIPEYRAVVNYRIQWPSLPNAFNTYAFSFDYNPRKYNSNFGLLITQPTMPDMPRCLFPASGFCR